MSRKPRLLRPPTPGNEATARQSPPLAPRFTQDAVRCLRLGLSLGTLLALKASPPPEGKRP